MEDCSTDERLQQETLCHRQWTDEYVERPETLMRQNVVFKIIAATTLIVCCAVVNCRVEWSLLVVTPSTTFRWTCITWQCVIRVFWAFTVALANNCRILSTLSPLNRSDHQTVSASGVNASSRLGDKALKGVGCDPLPTGMGLRRGQFFYCLLQQ